MIPSNALTTNHAKAAQDNLLRIGERGADVHVLIVGSCRAVPYLNYMLAYNRAAKRNVFHAGYVNPAVSLNFVFVIGFLASAVAHPRC